MGMEKKKDKFLDRLIIDKSTIDDALRQQATLIYQYGLRKENLRYEYSKLITKLELLESKKAVEIRAKYRRVKGALSETHVKDLVRSDEEVIKLKDEINEKEHLLNLAKIKSNSLEVKGENLINFAHNVREESKSGRRK